MLLKALKFEIKRIFYNNKNIIFFILILLAFALFCFSYKNTIYLKNVVTNEEKTFESIVNLRDEYKKNYEIAYGIIEKPEGLMLPYNFYSMKEYYRYNYLLYDYYVNTHTSYNDYIFLEYLNDNCQGLETGVFVAMMAKALPFFIYIMSLVLASFYIFSDSYSKNKLFVQSDVSLKNIYLAKLISALLFLILISLIYCLIVLIFALDGDYYVLIVKENVTKMNIEMFLIIKLVISLSNGLLLILISSLFYCFIKNALYNFFTSLSFVGLFYVIFYVIKRLIDNDIRANKIQSYFPFVNSHYLNYSIYDNQLWGIVFINIILMILMIVIYNKKEGVKYD